MNADRNASLCDCRPSPPPRQTLLVEAGLDPVVRRSKKNSVWGNQRDDLNCTNRQFAQLGVCSYCQAKWRILPGLLMLPPRLMLPNTTNWL